jgi:hypothetical protein
MLTIHEEAHGVHLVDTETSASIHILDTDLPRIALALTGRLASLVAQGRVRIVDDDTVQNNPSYAERSPFDDTPPI